MAGTEGGLHPTVSKKLKPANIHVSEIMSGSSTVGPSYEIAGAANTLITAS